MAPGARSKFAPPYLQLRSFGSKCTVLKKVLVRHCWGSLAPQQPFGVPTSDLPPPYWLGARGIAPPLSPLVAPQHAALHYTPPTFQAFTVQKENRFFQSPFNMGHCSQARTQGGCRGCIPPPDLNRCWNDTWFHWKSSPKYFCTVHYLVAKDAKS